MPVTTRVAYTGRLTDRLHSPGVGFDPYRRIRRARLTKRGDILFLVTFLVVIAALLVWAML